MSAGPRVKICGITRRADAEAAVEAGAELLGVVLAPGGKRTVDATAVARLVDGLDVLRVGVLVDAGEEGAARAGEAAGLDVLQLHGDETPEEAAALRQRGWTVWKAVRVRTAADVLDAAARFAGAADGLLLDGWSDRARGGTGTAFPWDEVAAIRDRLPGGLRLAVAGGLRPDNVARAASLLRPDVVDVSSGVESAPGIKDADAVRRFVAAVRSASTGPG